MFIWNWKICGLFFQIKKHLNLLFPNFVKPPYSQAPNFRSLLSYISSILTPTFYPFIHLLLMQKFRNCNVSDFSCSSWAWKSLWMVCGLLLYSKSVLSLSKYSKYLFDVWLFTQLWFLIIGLNSSCKQVVKSL